MTDGLDARAERNEPRDEDLDNGRGGVKGELTGLDIQKSVK